MSNKLAVWNALIGPVILVLAWQNPCFLWVLITQIAIGLYCVIAGVIGIGGWMDRVERKGKR